MTATLQRDGLAWTTADDAALRDLLDASCSSRHELEPPPLLARTPSIFNREGIFCLNPRLVDPNTGEIILFCRSRSCEYCFKTEAIRMSFKVMRASPSHQFTLTCIGSSPEEWGPKRKRFIRLLRNLGVEWWMAVEVAPETYRPHVHGFLKGEITPAQFKALATQAGIGRVKLDYVPADRKGLAMHFAYPLKSLDSPDPVVRDEFLRWNRKGSRIGFESHSRGFFNQKESSSGATPDDSADEPNEPVEDDDFGKAISSQEPLETPAKTDTSETPQKPTQSRTESLSRPLAIKFYLRPIKFYLHPVRALTMIAKSGLFARSRGP